MGGYGSGRPGARPVAEQSLALRIGRFRRDITALVEQTQPGCTAYIDNRLVWTRGGYYAASTGYRLYYLGRGHQRMLLVLSYTYNKEETILDAIDLDSTPCTYGGRRYWFRCARCYRRVGVLYAPGKYWRCRHCYNITYQSSNDSDPRVSRLLRDPAAFFALSRRDDGDPIGMYKKTTAELIVLLKAYGKLGKL
jgi:hypothetical protein